MDKGGGVCTVRNLELRQMGWLQREGGLFLGRQEEGRTQQLVFLVLITIINTISEPPIVTKHIAQNISDPSTRYYNPHFMKKTEAHRGEVNDSLSCR